MLDLKPVGGGLKRWATAYNVCYYRCHGCGVMQVTEECLTGAAALFTRGFVGHQGIHGLSPS